MEFSKVGKKILPDTVKVCQDKSAIREVIGCLILDPQRLTLYPLNMDDFVEPFHQAVFSAIFNMAREGATELTGEIIETYLKENFPLKHDTYIANNGNKYVKEATMLATEDNFIVNYNTVRKWSLLRNLMMSGIDVSEYFDPGDDPDVAEIKRDKFQADNLKVMLATFETKLAKVGQQFTNKLDRVSRLAGGREALEQIEKFKEKKGIELSYASQFMTTVTYGIQRGNLTVGSAPTGVGKTRMSIANMCYSFAPKIYDKETQQWIDNPHGSDNRALYIGTEMELINQVEPIIWAYMADVNTEHILMGSYDEGEEERVKQAVEYLRPKDENGLQKGGIYLEYLPNFNVASLETVIKEHVVRPHNVKAVFFDYIFPTSELLSEYRQIAGAMGTREDQALSYLSTKLKDMARAYEVSIDTWTQVTGNWKDDQVRDQTIVRGSKAIIDKADTAFIATHPTPLELTKIKKIMDNMITKYENPNLCLTIYKNRSGRYNDIKIWLYIDYGSMRVHDLFVTHLDYEPVIGLQKSIVMVTPEGETRIFTSRDAKEQYEQGLISQEDYQKFQTQEKNDPSYTGNMSREDQKKLIQLENATIGGALMGKAAEEVQDDFDEENFDY